MEGEGEVFSLSLPAFLSSAIPLLFFLPKIRKRKGHGSPGTPPLDPPAATDLARVGLKHWLHISYSV